MIFGGDGQGAGFLLLTRPNLQGPFSGLLPDAGGKEFARQAARFFLFIKKPVEYRLALLSG
jgi:hypothetical protein